VRAAHRQGRAVIWRQRAMLLMGVLVLLVAAYTLVDYYRFTQCQQTVNEQAAHVDIVRGASFEKSLDAQIEVANALLAQQAGDPKRTRAALVEYRATLEEQKRVRDAFERPEPEKCQ
jgi:hypothetical protein